MVGKFIAQTLVKTCAADERRLELTFSDAKDRRLTMSLPASLAADLAPVLLSMMQDAADSRGGQLTKKPKKFSVGHARYERLILLKFDDDPPYALAVDDARMLSREMLDESEDVSSLKEPALQ